MTREEAETILLDATEKFAYGLADILLRRLIPRIGKGFAADVMRQAEPEIVDLLGETTGIAELKLLDAAWPQP